MFKKSLIPNQVTGLILRKKLLDPLISFVQLCTPCLNMQTLSKAAVEVHSLHFSPESNLQTSVM